MKVSVFMCVFLLAVLAAFCVNFSPLMGGYLLIALGVAAIMSLVGIILSLTKFSAAKLANDKNHPVAMISMSAAALILDIIMVCIGWFSFARFVALDNSESVSFTLNFAYSLVALTAVFAILNIVVYVKKLKKSA